MSPKNWVVQENIVRHIKTLNSNNTNIQTPNSVKNAKIALEKFENWKKLGETYINEKLDIRPYNKTSKQLKL